MLKTTLRYAMLCSLLVLAAAPATAADANFQANCDPVDPDSLYCEFDANRTPPGQTPTSCGLAFPVRYFWRFGDGASAVTPVPFVDHLYGPTPVFTPVLNVCMSVECSDGTTAYQCHCLDFTGQGNFGSCIEPGGWTPR
ncbi:MAG: hypothetical protein AAF657_12570 [Acidobacteriota bacterium]